MYFFFQAAKLPEDIKREHGGARIVITEVKKHHAGKYNCLAENVAGSDRATIDIHVAGKGYVIFLKVKSGF